MRPRRLRRAFVFVLMSGLPGLSENAWAEVAPAALPPNRCVDFPSVSRVGDAFRIQNPPSLWHQTRLTAALPDQRGAVWSAARVDVTKHFSHAAWVYLGDDAGAGGGEGLAFVLHNDPAGTAALGPFGRGLGAAEGLDAGGNPVAGLQRAAIVEFDTRRSLDSGWGDPEGDHVALYASGGGRHVGDAYPPPHAVPGGLRDGLHHLLRFSWDPVSKRFQAYVDNRLAQTLHLPDPLGFFGSELLYWGYAGATSGAAQNEQRVCLQTAPAPPAADYGDAPASYGHAWHLRPAERQSVLMGHVATAYPSTEAASLSNATATGDANEDPFIPNTPNWSGGYVPLRGWGGGYLNAWIDWNRDGVFSDAEQVIRDAQDEGPQDMRKGPDNYMQVFAPPRPDLMTGGEGPSFIRMRWSTQTGLGPTGEAPDGEVEDHVFTLVAPKTIDCGTAPFSSGAFASGGAGLYKSDIFWLDWTCAGSNQINAGDVVSKTWILPDGHRLTGRLHDIRGSMRAYQMGSFSNESLNRLYQGLQWVGLTNRYQNSAGNSAYVGFKLALELRKPDGTLLPYSLTTVATEAEAVNTDENLTLGANGEPWSLIDGEGSTAATYADGGRTVFIHSQGGGFGGQILASPGASEIDVLLGPNAASPSVAAFGVFVGSDYGDGPSSAGAAGHLRKALFQGAVRPSVSTAVVAAHRASRLPPDLLLGATVSVEATPRHGAEADGDDDDGVGFSRTDAASGLPLFDKAQPTRVEVAATGAGYLRVWADWSRDGAFQTSELVVDDLRDGGAGDLDGTAGRIAFDLRAPANLTDGRALLRFRWSAMPGVGPSEPVAQGGEAEDYRIAVVQPVAAPLSCPAGHNLREVLLNGELTATASGGGHVWPGWSVPAGWSYAAPGLFPSDDSLGGSAVQSGLQGLGIGPSALGGAVLTAEVRWINGADPALSLAASRLALAVEGVERLVLESGAGASPLGTLRHPATGLAESFLENEWGLIRADLPPVAAPSGATLSIAFAPPGGGTRNDDFQIRKLSLQICEPVRGDLRLEMRASSMTPTIDDVMEFEVYAHNEGGSPVTGLVVRDQIPGGYAFISATASQGSYVASTGLWTVGSIPPGESRLLRLKVVPLRTGVWRNVAEATAYTHQDEDSLPNNGVTTEDDYAALTPEPQAHSGGAFAEPHCPTGEPARQILLNGEFAAWSSSMGWPGWSQTGVGVWTRADAFTPGAYASNDFTASALRQSGIAGANRGPGLSGGGLLHLEIWWRNGAPPGASPSATLTINYGGLAYARLVTPVGAGAAAQTTFLNGAAGQPARLTEFAATPFQLHLPATAAASGELSFHFQPNGLLSDDFRIRRAALYVCDGELRLTPNHESTVPPGQLAIYPHRLIVSPSTTTTPVGFEILSDRGLSWMLYKDDGDGVFDASTDPLWTSGVPLAAGPHDFWIVARLPHGTPAGWRDVTTLRAMAVLPNGTTLFAEAQDVTVVGGAAEGQIHARKSVARDSDCDGQPDEGAPFLSELPVGGGGCVVYRIAFENRSVEPVTRVRIHDQTPDWTGFIGGSAQILEASAALRGSALPTIEHPAPSASGPILFAFDGTLPPGDRGLVQFGVRIAGGSGAAPVRPN